MLAAIGPASGFAYVAGAGIADGGATLSYVADPGQANNVTVELTGGNFILTDTGVVTITDADGAVGCTVTGNQATCPAVGVTTIRVEPGDGDDTVAVGAPTLALVVVRGGGRDTVACDVGDSVAADAEDAVTGCQADLPPDTTLVSVPSVRTADNTPEFTFSSDPDVVLFECRIDTDPFANCSSPFTSPTLPDGSHSFEVRASDSFGSGPTAASQAFVVDTTAPETAIDSGPPSTTNSTSATISFLSPDPGPVTFECKLDQLDWRTCVSPASYSDLSEATHVFSVRAVDDVGNADPTEATVSFTVTSKPVGISGLPPGLVVVRPPASFVLIAARTIKVSRKRIATVTLNCSGSRDCAGELTLITAKRIKLSRKRRRFVRLGAATFFIPAPRTLTVSIPLTKRAFRIVRKRKRLKTMVTVTDRDRVGRTRISTREVFLKAR